MKKLVTVWDARLEAEVSLAALPTRTHGSIIDPDRADKDNQEKIQESPDEKQKLGLEGDQTKRWLKRNTTHFVQIIIPRMPNANVFRLTNFPEAK